MSDAEADSDSQGPGDGQRYYGKYRGTVFSNLDPEQRGRIIPIVPDVQGLTPLSWAMPCVPIAGKQEGAPEAGSEPCCEGPGASHGASIRRSRRLE